MARRMVLIALLVAACGSSSTPAPQLATPTPEASPTRAPSPTRTPVPAPTATPDANACMTALVGLLGVHTVLSPAVDAVIEFPDVEELRDQLARAAENAYEDLSEAPPGCLGDAAIAAGTTAFLYLMNPYAPDFSAATGRAYLDEYIRADIAP